MDINNNFTHAEPFYFSLQQLLGNSKTDVNLEGDLGNTPLVLAASVDNHEALLMLVNKKKTDSLDFTFFVKKSFCKVLVF